jgi:hypothetical protein
MNPWSTLSAALLLATATLLQAPERIDTSRIGPQIGVPIPAFSGRDQLGRLQTLETSAGPKGLMLVFFRSADW